MSFNPEKHLTQVKGKDYLEVKWRLVWFRDDQPNGRIETEILEIDLDKNKVIVRAKIYDEKDRLLATGHKKEEKANLEHWLENDYIEKAETGAVGRALAQAGYGTQFSPELEEGDHVVDSPVKSNNTSNGKVKNDNSKGNGKVICDADGCNEELSEKVIKYCKDNADQLDNRLLCFEHQKKYKNGDKKSGTKN